MRVSTKKQEAEGHSLGAQEARLRAYAKAQDVELVGIEVDSESGKDTHRPGLQRALERLKTGGADGLLVMKMDRLTRSVRDLDELVAEYFKTGLSLLSVSDSVDTRSASGRLVLNLLMSVAQWEREVIAERTKEGLAHARTKGKGTPRLEGPALERIRALSAAGSSLREIAAALTAEGIPTLKGGKWAAETVRKVLARPGMEGASHL